MNKLVIIIVVVSNIINCISDYYLSYGKNRNIKDKYFTVMAKNTPDKYLYYSGISGVFAISMWMFLLYYLSYVKGIAGTLLMVTYAIFIGSNMAYHLACSRILLFAKYTNMEEAKIKKQIVLYGLPNLFFATIYSFIMIYLGMSKVLEINIFQYFTLPIFSILIIHAVFGYLIKIKHFDTISGTIAMLISMLSTISIITNNFSI